ncbi:MAG: YbjN domain-containing protein [Nostocaceae cyanobacterium]|nr:YbjN domain-containing protein [Nostocaceae cyanobacterium]
MATYQPDPQMVAAASVANNEPIEELLEDNTGINHVEVIETVIDSMEEDDSAMVSHLPEGGYLWKFNYGSVEVFVQLAGTSDADTITVWSPVRPLPAKDEPRLMRHLLEMNGTSTFESRFAIIDDQVVVIATRTLADLSASEVSRLITVVASIADENDEALRTEF